MALVGFQEEIKFSKRRLFLIDSALQKLTQKYTKLNAEATSLQFKHNNSGIVFLNVICKICNITRLEEFKFKNKDE